MWCTRSWCRSCWREACEVCSLGLLQMLKRLLLVRVLRDACHRRATLGDGARDTKRLGWLWAWMP